MGILSFIRATPTEPPVDWEAKFKKATADLAESAFRIEALEADLRSANADAEEWKAAAIRNGEIIDARNREIGELLPDAEAMRAKRKRDREQQAAKKEGRKDALPTASKAKAPAKKVVGK